MKLDFGGVRGTTPRADPRFRIYGGHTTCLLVTGADGELLMLDAGSGAQAIAKYLPEFRGEHRKLLVLLTHLHLDHILGLPMLAPLYDPDWRIEIAAVGRPEGFLEEALDRIMSPPLWPLTLEQAPASVSLTPLPAPASPAEETVLELGGLRIRGVSVNHPDDCTAWRIDEPSTGSSMVLATDVEWKLADQSERGALLTLCGEPEPAGLLVMDGHFTADEIEAHEGWGHSSLDECVHVARTAGVAKLMITHHAPDNDDARLREIEAELKGLWETASLARQDQRINLEEIG